MLGQLAIKNRNVRARAIESQLSRWLRSLGSRSQVRTLPSVMQTSIGCRGHRSLWVSGVCPHIHTYTAQAAYNYRGRSGWVSTVTTASFPLFEGPRELIWYHKMILMELFLLIQNVGEEILM